MPPSDPPAFGTSPGFPGYHHEPEPYDAKERRVDPGASYVPGWTSPDVPGACHATTDPAPIPRHIDRVLDLAIAHNRPDEYRRAALERDGKRALSASGEVPSLHAPGGQGMGRRYVVRRADELPPETMVAPFGRFRAMAENMALMLTGGEREASDLTWVTAETEGNAWCVADTSTPIAPPPDPLPIVTAVLLEHYASAHGAAAVVVALEAAGLLGAVRR